jgi:hypothetical protein
MPPSRKPDKHAWENFKPDNEYWKGYAWENIKPDDEFRKGIALSARIGNSPDHALEGQNILFLDSHVSFEKSSFCGVNDDNIYTPSESQDPNKISSKGLRPTRYDMNPENRPKHKQDSYLVQ